MLLYERFSMFTVSLLYEHSLDCFVHFRVFIFCCIIPIYFVDEGIKKKVAHGSCWHTPIVVAYYMINVLHLFEQGSELEYITITVITRYRLLNHFPMVDVNVDSTEITALQWVNRISYQWHLIRVECHHCSWNLMRFTSNRLGGGTHIRLP